MAWHFERVTLPNGLHMRVARAGSGPLIVMLHGFPECWYSWRHQLKALSSAFSCAAPDLRGYGETDAPVGVSNYKIGKLVEDVAGLIEVMGRRRAVLMGHDWGGAVAWSTAMMRPDVVEKLVVMNCPHPVMMRKHLRSNLRQLGRSWYIFFFQLPWLPEAILRASDYRLVRRALRGSAAQKAAFSDEDLEHFREAFKRRYSLTAAINYYRALPRSEMLLRRSGSDHWLERRISAPTLLIWGERDFALGKELTYGMEPLFSGPFQVKYVPDSGHWVQQEKPELVNNYLREFLTDLAQAG